MAKNKDLNIEYPDPPINHTIEIPDNTNNPNQEAKPGCLSPVSADCLDCCCNCMGLCLEIIACCLLC